MRESKWQLKCSDPRYPQTKLSRLKSSWKLPGKHLEYLQLGLQPGSLLGILGRVNQICQAVRQAVFCLELGQVQPVLTLL